MRFIKMTVFSLYPVFNTLGLHKFEVGAVPKSREIRRKTRLLRPALSFPGWEVEIGIDVFFLKF